MIKATIKTIFIFLHILDSHGQEGPKYLSIEKILEKALEHSSLLKSNTQEILSYEFMAIQSGKWENPTISGNLGTYTIRPDSGIAVNLLMMQRIPFFEQKKAQQKLGEKNTQIYQQFAQFEELKLRHQIFQLCTQLVFINEEFGHISHRRKRLEIIKQYLTSRNFPSPNQIVDKNLIESRIREILEEILNIQGNRNRVWLDLNMYLQLPTMIIPQMGKMKSLDLPIQGELLNQMHKDAPILKKSQKLLQASEMAISVAKSLRYPDIRLGVGAYHQAVGIQDRELSLFGAFEISIPFFDFGDNRIRAATTKYNSEQLKMEHEKKNLVNQFDKLYSELTQAKERTKIYPKSLIKQLEHQLDISEKSWEKGHISTIALLELETQTHLQTIKVYQSLHDYMLTLSNLHLLVGKDIPK